MYQIPLPRYGKGAERLLLEQIVQRAPKTTSMRPRDGTDSRAVVGCMGS